MALEDNEPAKLTEKMMAEISNEEPIDDMVKPLNDVISPDNLRQDYEKSTSVPESQETRYIETAKEEERKQEPEKTRKGKKKESDITEKSLSKLHSDLRKHSDARRKTDLAIKDIEKQLKGLLLTHHSAIKDLKKEVAKLRREVAVAGSRKNAIKTRTKKTETRKSKNASKKKSRKR
jgi:hypothetical protein